MTDASRSSVNIPQIIAVGLVGFLAIRWWMSKPSPSGGGAASSSSTHRGQQIDVARVDQVAAMFPQLDRRTIAWDLHRNGGSVSATTERVLAGRGLDQPPPSYQPNLPSPEQRTAPAGSSRSKASGKTAQEDLITRYNLQNRVGGKGKEAVPSEEQKRSAWSSDKAARAEGLRKRREDMILAARRRMEEKGSEA